VRSKIFRGQAGRQNWEVREVGKFGRLVRSKFFIGQISRQICEGRLVGYFGRIGRSWILSGREIWKDSESETVGRILISEINVVFNLLIQCVSYL
jgi:hypothetical protein